MVGVSQPRATALTAEGKQVPDAVVARMLIDTGASHTCIDETILRPLKLEPTGSIAAHTPSTGGNPHVMFQYDVALLLYHQDNSRFLGNVPVSAVDFSAQSIDGILGRDILSLCLLVYDGRAVQFSLAF